MKIVAANRHELWVSIIVVCATFCLPSMPIGFVGALVIGGAMLVGLFCAINAALDMDNMGVIEIYAAGLWLVAMLILTPWMLYSIATMQSFARK